jgi:hypothetical protein
MTMPRGRTPLYADDFQIKVLVSENPHRAGSGRYARWHLYRDGMTVKEAIEAGLNSSNLRFSVLDGHIAIERAESNAPR